MTRACILVADMPRMLREIVEDIVQSQPDMELVTHDDTDELDVAIKRHRVDVVIAGDHGICGATPEQLLLLSPDLKMIVVAGDGRSGKLFEFRRRLLVDLSPQSLVNAIRVALNSNN